MKNQKIGENRTSNFTHPTSQKGITLVALVITIIVMLILVGVTLSFVLNDNGIISKTQETRTKQEVRTIEEGIENIRQGIVITKLSGGNITEEERNEITDQLKAINGVNDAEYIADANQIKVTYYNNTKTMLIDLTTGEKTNGILLSKTEVGLWVGETETITATLTEGIEGTITWTNTDNTAAIISRETGETITVTAVGVGETTITATCGEYSLQCTVKAKEIAKGDFIEYEVAYTDVYISQPYTTTNGWRLLDFEKNEDGTYSNVKIISTGIPAKLNYSYRNTASWWETDATKLNEFKTTLGGENYTFYTGVNTYYGLQASAGMYNNFASIPFVQGLPGYNQGNYIAITKGGTAVTGNTTGGDLFLTENADKVRLLTIPELNNLLERTDIYSITRIPTTEPAIGLLRLDKLSSISGMENYSYSFGGEYWLASPYPHSNIYDVICYVGAGGVYDNTTIRAYGVRPLVSLASDVQLVDTNSDWVLEIVAVD